MKRTAWAGIAVVAAIAVCFGCKGQDDGFAPAVTPKVVRFDGTIVPKYVGVWASSEGSSTLDIRKNGDLAITATTRYASKKSIDHAIGQWRVVGTDLLFRYVDGNQPSVVVKYSASLVANTLTLSQSGGKLKSVYRRTTSH